MMKKLLSLLGLGMKAGYVISGEMGCSLSIKKGNSKLLIIASNASLNTKEKFINLSNKNNVKYYEIGLKEELGSAIGKGLTSVISIRDEAFSKAIIKIIEEIITCK